MGAGKPSLSRSFQGAGRFIWEGETGRGTPLRKDSRVVPQTPVSWVTLAVLGPEDSEIAEGEGAETGCGEGALAEDLRVHSLI